MGTFCAAAPPDRTRRILRAGSCGLSLIHDEVTPCGRLRPTSAASTSSSTRAETHLETFRKEAATFSERDPAPFGFRPEDTPRSDKSVEYVLYAVVREQLLSDLAPIVGDVIHNIRSALEHFAWEITPRRARSRRTQFPIFTDECEFKVRSPPMLKGIKGYERTFIEGMQPYVASNPPRLDPLAILSELSNLDKHRLLVPIIAAVDRTDVWAATSNADITWHFIEVGPVEHDAKIVAFTATPQDPSKEMQVHTQSGLEIRLRDTGADDLGMSARDLLGMILHHVRWNIEWMFERGRLPPTWAEVEALQ